MHYHGRPNEVFSFVVLYMEIEVLKECGDYINETDTTCQVTEGVSLGRTTQ